LLLLDDLAEPTETNPSLDLVLLSLGAILPCVAAKDEPSAGST